MKKTRPGSVFLYRLPEIIIFSLILINFFIMKSNGKFSCVNGDLSNSSRHIFNFVLLSIISGLGAALWLSVRDFFAGIHCIKSRRIPSPYIPRLTPCAEMPFSFARAISRYFLMQGVILILVAYMLLARLPMGISYSSTQISNGLCKSLNVQLSGHD